MNACHRHTASVPLSHPHPAAGPRCTVPTSTPFLPEREGALLTCCSHPVRTAQLEALPPQLPPLWPQGPVIQELCLSRGCPSSASSADPGDGVSLRASEDVAAGVRALYRPRSTHRGASPSLLHPQDGPVRRGGCVRVVCKRLCTCDVKQLGPDAIKGRWRGASR